jgi:hypothetical protein
MVIAPINACTRDSSTICSVRPRSLSAVHTRPDVRGTARHGVDQPVHSVVVGGGLVHDQSAEFRPLRREEHQTEHPLTELVDGIIEGALGFEEAAELREQVVDHRPPERLLGGEVVVDLRLMGSGADRDRSGGGASEAVSSELDGRGIDQLATDVDLSVVTSGIDDTISAISPRRRLYCTVTTLMVRRSTKHKPEGTPLQSPQNGKRSERLARESQAHHGLSEPARLRAANAIEPISLSVLSREVVIN